MSSTETWPFSLPQWCTVAVMLAWNYWQLISPTSRSWVEITNLDALYRNYINVYMINYSVFLTEGQ